MLIRLLEFFQKPRILGKPHKGYVVFNDDPKFLQRIKVYVPGVLEGGVDALPWCYPWNPAGLGGRLDIGVMSTPTLNTEVVVEFPTEDPYMPFYTGVWQSDLTTNQNLREDYPYCHGWTDDGGNQFKVNRSKGTTEYNAASGATIRVERDSTVSVQSAKGIRFQSIDKKTEIFLDLSDGAGTMSLTPKDTMTIGGTQVNIKGKETNINAGTVNENINGGKISEITGGRNTSIGGADSTAIISNQALTVGGDRSKTVVGKSDNTYGMDVKDTVVLGDMLTRLIAGNRDVQIILGNYKINLLAGNYTVDIVAGNIKINTKVGSIDLGNLLGQIGIGIDGSIKINATTSLDAKALISTTIEGTATCTIKGALMTVQGTALAEVKAPLVKLGPGLGPVLTQLTSPLVDMITGTPSVGSPTVLA